MWNLKTVSVIVEALRMIEIGTDKRINKIPGNPNLMEIPKKKKKKKRKKSSPLSGTAHLLESTINMIWKVIFVSIVGI